VKEVQLNACNPRFEDEGATATAVWTWLSSDKKTRLLQCANVGGRRKNLNLDSF
jgi:hypothetical protein